jgi:hypothetical protein
MRIPGSTNPTLLPCPHHTLIPYTRLYQSHGSGRYRQRHKASADIEADKCTFKPALSTHANNARPRTGTARSKQSTNTSSSAPPPPAPVHEEARPRGYSENIARLRKAKQDKGTGMSTSAVHSRMKVLV